MDRVVTFVCLHGAGKSRVAAALFNVNPPAGWWAQSAGVEPQSAASPHAAALLAQDTAALAALDRSAPQALSGAGDLVVAIDCAVPEAVQWDLADEWPSPEVVAELRTLTTRLISELGQQTHGS